MQAAHIDERVNAASEGDVSRARAGGGAMSIADVHPDSHPAGEVGAGAQADIDAAKARARADVERGSGATASRADGESSLAETLGTAVFYFVILLFIPAILDTLQLAGILAPVQGLVNEIVGFLPNLLLAGIILVVGGFVARVLRKIVANLADAAGANKLSDEVGLSRRRPAGRG